MSKSEDDIYEDDELYESESSGDVIEDGDGLKADKKNMQSKNADALRKIEEYKRKKELMEQMAFYDDDPDSMQDDFLSDV